MCFVNMYILIFAYKNLIDNRVKHRNTYKKIMKTKQQSSSSEKREKFPIKGNKSIIMLSHRSNLC